MIDLFQIHCIPTDGESRCLNKEKHMKTKSFQILIITCLLIITSGCSSVAGYKRPISNFQNASSVVINSTRIYLAELNKVERNKYIDKQTTEKKNILLSDINKSQLFSREQIQLRLEALDLLSQYGDLLGQLANSDVPERITSNADNLGSALSKLSNDISTARGETGSNFSSAIGPVTTIVGEVARLAVERKMEEALDNAVTKGEKPIISLIDTIRTDIVSAYQRKKNALSTNRVVLIDKYNVELKKVNSGNGNAIQLEKDAEELKSFLDLWESFPSSNPNEGLEAMKKAHQALVDYAKSDKNDKDLADFVEAMEVFTLRAQRVGVAVNQLQNI